MNTDPEIERRYAHLDTLPNIAERLKININTMNRWAERGRKLGFPEPVRRLGRYRLYNADEVEEWVVLWMKISKNLGNENLPSGRKKDN